MWGVFLGPERKKSGGTRVVMFGAWILLLAMVPLTVQSYVEENPALAWSLILVGSIVFVVGIIFALGRSKRGGKLNFLGH
jgi:hypothetical protein